MLNLKAADNLKPAEKSQEEQFIQSAKITAIDGFQELPDPALKVKVVDLAKNASDIKVQEAALAALKK